MIRKIYFTIAIFMLNSIFSIGLCDRIVISEKYISKTNSVLNRTVLNTKISPPYQIIKRGKLSGSSIKTLNCIFEKMGRPFEINIVPWKRARINIQTGKAHGYFTATHYDKLYPYATLSVPIAIEKWYLYYMDKKLLKGSNYKERLKIGAIAGSNHSTWLNDNNYRVAVEVETYTQLLKLLRINRINAFLADKKTTDEEIEKLDLKNESFYVKFYKYTPLGVYFSNKFLERNPGFLDEFNNKTPSCVTDAFKLSNTEKSKIRVMVSGIISEIKSTPLLVKTVKRQNRKYRSFVKSGIIKLSKKWETTKKPLFNNLSKFLLRKKKESNGLITEIFVFDRKGLNVAQSDETSDYWQGDELKYLKTYKKGPGSLFIDSIKYDESSRKFQIQVSFTVTDFKNGDPVGGITIGLDAEKAMAVE